MDKVRLELCKNEDALALFCRDKKIKYASTTKKKYFCELDHDGDLVNYITKSMASDDMKHFSEMVHECGFKTCLDLINEYYGTLLLDDFLDIQDIKPKAEYSTYQIAAMAQKYNIVVGMQYVERSGRKYVIIKSTLENNKSLQGYRDHWISPDKTLCYYMQKENPKKAKKFTFSYEPNQRIFDSIFSNSIDPLDIYVFTRENSGDRYVYQGIFHSLGLAEDGRAFILGNIETPSSDPAIDFAKRQFENQFQSASIASVVEQKRDLVCVKPPVISNVERTKNYAKLPEFVSERDYIYEAKLRQKIGDLGEEAVWDYEQRKIREALINDPKFAEELIGKMEWVSKKPHGERYGYDIQSFDIVEGRAVPIFIEVKTTTSNNEDGFYITEHELETAHSEEIGKNYYLYRVYNINSDQPLFYYVKGNPANFYKLKPFIWLAKIR